MASWRITMLGPGKRLGGAALPVPAKDAGGWSSRGPVNGHPGTMRIPAPAPVPHTDRELTALANSGFIGLPSSDFSTFNPSLYYINGPQERFPGSLDSDNQMPVPAIDPRGIPGVVMPGPVMLNQFQVDNPAVRPKYLNRK